MNSIQTADEFFQEQMIPLLKKMAETGSYSDLCLDNGFLIVPVHFYQPIPDLKELEKRNIWDKISKMQGIKFDDKIFIENLEKLSKYAVECVWSEEKTHNEHAFYVNNYCFSYSCAAMLHSVIRQNKPKRIIEIGSGHSSKIIRDAIQKNKTEGFFCEQYIIIDPYSPVVLESFDSNTILIKEPVETIDINLFKSLEKDDILFIDSSHVCKIGSDVNYEILEILPILQQGVFIHFHDIDLPYEYPKTYATKPNFRMFWTESYLLQAFLSFNSAFEVYLPMKYIHGKYQKLYQAFYPNVQNHALWSSSSFWITRI